MYSTVSSLFRATAPGLMPTFQQLTRNARWTRPTQIHRYPTRPHLSGICVSVFTMSPKKPNSANRKVAKVRLSTGQIVLAKIPGVGHPLHQHSKVLVMPKETKDIPGCHFKIIPGAMDYKRKK
eukprot:Rmarinus@m.24681